MKRGKGTLAGGGLRDSICRCYVERVESLEEFAFRLFSVLELDILTN